MTRNNPSAAEAKRRIQFLIDAAAAYAAAAKLGPDPDFELWDATFSDGLTD